MSPSEIIYRTGGSSLYICALYIQELEGLVQDKPGDCTGREDGPPSFRDLGRPKQGKLDTLKH